MEATAQMTTMTATATAMTIPAAMTQRAPETAATAVGAATGAPRLLLRLEAAAVVAGAAFAYAALSGRWGLFALLFLLPDLSMLGYAFGRRAGAVAYNAAHSYVGPALLAAIGATLGAHALWPIACIWVAHVGFDRLLGYGLKYGSAFGDTHLGRIGRSTRR